MLIFLDMACYLLLLDDDNDVIFLSSLICGEYHEYRPQVTIATAIVFCHRFFLRQSHVRNDRRVSPQLFKLNIGFFNFL